MKNILKKAHEMTREIKREYPNVDYKTQLGICISYLYNEKEENEMTNLEMLIEDFRSVVSKAKFEGELIYSAQEVESACEKLQEVFTDENILKEKDLKDFGMVHFTIFNHSKYNDEVEGSEETLVDFMTVYVEEKGYSIYDTEIFKMFN